MSSLGISAEYEWGPGAQIDRHSILKSQARCQYRIFRSNRLTLKYQLSMINRSSHRKPAWLKQNPCWNRERFLISLGDVSEITSEFPGLAVSTAQGQKSFYAVNRAEITRRRLEPYAIGNGCLYGRRKARYSTSKP